MVRRLHPLAVVAATVALAAAAVHAPAVAAPAARPAADEAANAAAAQAMFSRLNDARVAAGLEPYRHSPLLAEVAAGHAREIAEHNHFSHTGRDGRSAKQRMADAGYGAGRTGVRTSENFVARATVAEGFDWLMSDADHRPNMMDPRFREVGVGVAPTRYGFVWVLDFGTYDGVDEAPAAAAATDPATPAATAAPTVTAASGVTATLAVSATGSLTAAPDTTASLAVTASQPVSAAAAGDAGDAAATMGAASAAATAADARPGDIRDAAGAPDAPAAPPAAPGRTALWALLALGAVVALGFALSTRRRGDRR